MAVKPIPEGYHSLTPYLSIQGAAEAIEFYKKAFNAEEIMRFPAPGGKVGHAEIKIGDSHVMIADEFPEMNFRSPKALGGSPVGLMLYVKNVDEVVARAIDLGAVLKRPVENHFYGDRSGTLEDPFGHTWFVSTHVEDVPAEEVARRAKEMAQKSG